MTARKAFLLFIVLLEWFALIAQFILQQQAGTAALGESLIRFFTYFTIFTNLLIAVYVTVQWVTPDQQQKGFFFNPSTETALALYITVVGLVYNIALRHLWDSTGLQAVLHDILHTAVPILMIIYWWRWVAARQLTFRNIPAWLIYPAAYAIVVLIRGHFSSWYPYPFLDAVKLGYSKVLLNSAVLVGVFLFFAIGFVWLGKRKRTP